MAQWEFKISGSNADSLTRSYTPETGFTLRILEDAVGKWSLVTGEWVDPHDDSSLGQLGESSPLPLLHLSGSTYSDSAQR